MKGYTISPKHHALPPGHQLPAFHAVQDPPFPSTGRAHRRRHHPRAARYLTAKTWL